MDDAAGGSQGPLSPMDPSENSTGAVGTSSTNVTEPRVNHQSGLPPSSLSEDIRLRILSFLPSNELAWSGRLTCKEAAQRFSDPRFRSISLRKQLPLAYSSPAEDACPQEQQQQQDQQLEQQKLEQQRQLLSAAAETGMLRRLTLRRKMALTAAAASSGCEFSLGVAWGLQRSCLFLDVGVPTWMDGVMVAVERYPDSDSNPGAPAARAGHSHLLRWMVQQGCPLHPGHTLTAVARFCRLGVLQAAWGLLRDGVGDGEVRLDSAVLDAAAGSHTEDAMAKVEWVLNQVRGGGGGGGTCALTEETAAAAAEANNLPLLQWLYGRGCPMQAALATALRHADLPVAAWLVSYVGCVLPQMDGRAGADAAAARLLRTRLTVAAAAAVDGIAKLDWLRAKGMSPCSSVALEAAAEQGRLDTVRHLHEVHGVQLSVPVFRMAAASGSIPLVEWLREQECAMYHGAFLAAGEKGNLAMVRWLLDTAHCPFRGDTVAGVVRLWPVMAPPADCLTAVQLLVTAGCPVGGPLPFPQVAKSGDVPLVRWLHDAGGWAMDQHTLYHAAHVGCDALLEWLVAGGCPTTIATAVDPYPPAAFARARCTLLSLLRLGVPMRDGTLVGAVRRGCPVVVLQWLVERGAPAGLAVATAALAAAAQLPHSAVQGQVAAWLEALVAAGAAAPPPPGVLMAAAVGVVAAIEEAASGANTA